MTAGLIPLHSLAGASASGPAAATARVGAEPQQLRVEDAHQPLAFGAQVVELPEKAAVSPQMTTTCEPGVWPGAGTSPRQQLDLTVDGYVLPGRL